MVDRKLPGAVKIWSDNDYRKMEQSGKQQQFSGLNLYKDYAEKYKRVIPKEDIMAAVKKDLEVGDTIKCHDKEEMVKLSMALDKLGYQNDFMYEQDGEKGLWIVIEGVERND